MPLNNDFTKYGLQLVNINGTYFVVEKGGYGQSAGAASVDANTAQQLIGQGVAPLVIPQQDAEAGILAQKYGLNFSTGKGNYSMGDIQNRITNGYVAGEANQTAEQKQVTDAAAANANLAAHPQAPTADPYASDPNMQNIGTADAPMYVPKGSAGALNSTNQSAYNAQYNTGATYDAQGHPVNIPAAVPAAPTTNTTVSAQAFQNVQIPFKPGLTPAQQSGITALAQKPISQWTAVDKANWGYATGNAPLPVQTSTASTGTGNATNDTSMTNTGTTFSQDGSGAVSRDMAKEQAFVNSFNAANHRLPTSAEVNQGVYGTTTPQFNTAQGTAAIQNATSGTGGANTGGTTGTAPNKALTDANAIIDASNLPADLKALYKNVVAQYPDKAFNTAAILDTFNKIKTETIDPHYYELANTAQKDFSTSLEQLNMTRQSQQESERTTAANDIRQAQANQEKSGMTFTGKAIETLGANSAYAQNPSATVATPTQTPFGGMFYEGTVNQGNRLMATSNAADYNKALQNLGRSAEDKLGTTGAGGLGIAYTPAGGVTSSLDAQKQQQYGTTLSQLYNNSQAKTDLNTNLPIS